VPNAIARAFNAIGGSLMARSGRVGIIGTTGAKTGKPRTTPIGFVRRADGRLLVGNGSPQPRGWTANLKANPACSLRIRGEVRLYRARLLGPEERAAALAELKAAMGSVAERAAWSDLFELVPEG
jgi:deazaflavin-dependent oxidoreductase (nitroreductase family)